MGRGLWGETFQTRKDWDETNKTRLAPAPVRPYLTSGILTLREKTASNLVFILVSFK